MLRCNPDDYRENLANLNLSEEKENEIIFALWDILYQLIEMRQGVSHIVPEHFSKNIKRADQISLNMLSQFNEGSSPTTH